jgi:hypothetical protein
MPGHLDIGPGGAIVVPGIEALGAIFNALGIGAADFSVRSFRTMYNYNYAPGSRPEYNVLYLLAGLLLPLLVPFAIGKAKALIKKK